MLYTITIPMLNSPFLLALIGAYGAFLIARAIVRAIDLVGV